LNVEERTLKVTWYDHFRISEYIKVLYLRCDMIVVKKDFMVQMHSATKKQ
jgi:hypothetical protein